MGAFKHIAHIALLLASVLLMQLIIYSNDEVYNESNWTILETESITSLSIMFLIIVAPTIAGYAVTIFKGQFKRGISIAGAPFLILITAIVFFNILKN